MAGKIDARLAELGVTLPQAASPVANYVGYVISGNQIFVSGQIPLDDGKLISVGTLGDSRSIDEGYAAARQCGLNLIAQAKAALGGDLDRIKRVVKLGGFVAGTPAFDDAPKVINGASDLMVDVFGDHGRHARFAVAVASLPMGASVEVDAIFEIA
jgi:enamine deaminase RidA (YjgF/YER057c/UK114 family)